VLRPAVVTPVAPAARVIASVRNPEKIVQEATPVRQKTASDIHSSEQSVTEVSASVKESATLDSGEHSSGNEQDGKQRNFNDQAHLMVQHQNKTEQPAVMAGSTQLDVGQKLSTESLDHVIQQVKEHLTTRDYKTGTEQVCIRLTPEHMGELKLNLRMENQQLKVEIVADNSMVRDTLLKHSDSLRETLATQNIKLGSFDVTTGGGNSNSPGHDRNDWRELARQRQQNSWMASGGYRMPEPQVPVAVANYQGRSKNSMVDLHF
jgi:flagellar hook-length control protein FliK